MNQSTPTVSHSPLPWTVDNYASIVDHGWNIRDANKRIIATTSTLIDAALIVEQVNRCRENVISFSGDLTDEIREALRDAPDEKIIALPDPTTTGPSFAEILCQDPLNFIDPIPDHLQAAAASLMAKLQAGLVELHGRPVTVEMPYDVQPDVSNPAPPAPPAVREEANQSEPPPAAATPAP